MRYSPKQLERKRGKKKTGRTKHETSAALAIFCAKDDFLMTPALTPADPSGRTTKRTMLYVCPSCGNTINPQTQNATHAMTVQTMDNAIEYRGKKHTIAQVADRTHEKKKDDDLAKFINDPHPYLDKFGVTVVKRTIVRQGAKRFKLAI